MIVVRIFKDNAGNFANQISAVTFEACKRRLKLYFSDLEKVKERIIAGEIIDIPYVTLQKDRRVNKEKGIKNERRVHIKSSRMRTASISTRLKEGELKKRIEEAR